MCINAPMKQPTKTTPKAQKGGRKSAKKRSHISLSENLGSAAAHMGQLTFGSKTAYLEHLILNDLERQGLTIQDIIKLAEEWKAKNERK